ncbi:MAG: PEP-CTERM sorting domain-containing protein [Thiobacillus sp.]
MTTYYRFTLAGLLALGAGAAHAAYIESGDASDVLAAAQRATDATIQGTIGQGDQGDVFKLIFGSAGTLTVNATGAIDSQIGLFAAGFNPLVGDDDAGASLDAFFSYGIAAGTYYLGIGDYATVALNGSNATWFMNGLAPAGFGPVLQIRNASSISAGSYTLALAMPPANGVPEPGTKALFGLGLLGVASLRRG